MTTQLTTYDDKSAYLVHEAVRTAFLRDPETSRSLRSKDEEWAFRIQTTARVARETFKTLGFEDLAQEWLVQSAHDMLYSFARNRSATLNTVMKNWREALGTPAYLEMVSQHRWGKLSIVDTLAQNPETHAHALASLELGATSISSDSLSHAIVHHKFDLLEALLIAGCPPNGTRSSPKANDLPLFFKAHAHPDRAAKTPDAAQRLTEKMWERLVEQGADVNGAKNGRSLLVNAISMRDAPTTLWLLDHKANVDEAWTFVANDGQRQAGSVRGLLQRWADEHRAGQKETSPAMARLLTVANELGSKAMLTEEAELRAVAESLATRPKYPLGKTWL